MPAKGGYPATFRSPGVHIVAGAFVTAGASAPTAMVGAGFTVSAPTNGVYTITLTDGKFNAALAVIPGIEQSAPNATVGVRWGANAIAAAGTFTLITSSSDGTDANLTGPVVSFIAVLRNTGAER